MKGNVIVGQSGGPTAVINSSLAGVFKTAMERGFSKVYGMRYGIQGFMDEQYIENVPAEFLRLREPEVDKKKILEALKEGKDLDGLAHLQQTSSLRIR